MIATLSAFFSSQTFIQRFIHHVVSVVIVKKKLVLKKNSIPCLIDRMNASFRDFQRYKLNQKLFFHGVVFKFPEKIEKSDYNGSCYLISKWKQRNPANKYLKSKRNKLRSTKKITYEQRLKTIWLVTQKGFSYRNAGKEIGICGSTVKMIIHTYRKEGRIYQKKVMVRPELEQQSCKEKQKEEKIEWMWEKKGSEDKNRIYNYYPYLTPLLNWNGSYFYVWP